MGAAKKPICIVHRREFGGKMCQKCVEAKRRLVKRARAKMLRMLEEVNGRALPS